MCVHAVVAMNLLGRYREDVTRWHAMIFQVFTKGGMSRHACVWLCAGVAFQTGLQSMEPLVNNNKVGAAAQRFHTLDANAMLVCSLRSQQFMRDLWFKI